MPQPIEFYFDFSSPYGYLASTQIDPLAAKYGRTVTWKPILLGAVFKVSGSKPLVDLPLKGDYFLRDFERSAKFFGVPFKLPPGFPFAPIAASRAYYWLVDRDADHAKRLAKVIYHAGLGIGQAALNLLVALLLGTLGCPRPTVTSPAPVVPQPPRQTALAVRFQDDGGELFGSGKPAERLHVELIRLL